MQKRATLSETTTRKTEWVQWRACIETVFWHLCGGETSDPASPGS